MKKHLVFVYGTLRQGECNHFFLERANLIELHSWTYGKLYDTGFGYPCMVSHHQSRVIGELYAVSDKGIKKLDELEGYQGIGENNDYDRIQQLVYTKNQEYWAKIYMYTPEKVKHLVEIKSGDWKKL